MTRPPRPQIDLLEPRRLLAVIYVDLNSPAGSRDGSNWSKAYKYLQDALAIAQPGDDIRIADGSYAPTTGTSRDATFTLRSGVDLRGGYAGFGAANPDARTDDSTILSGEIGGSGASDNIKTIVKAVSLSESITIDGLQIRGAYSTDASGGGALVNLSAVTFSNVSFHSNRAKEGGAIFNVTSDTKPLAILDCTFTANRATNTGSAIRQSVQSTSNLAASFYIANSNFTQHTNDSDGAIIYATRQVSILDSTFTNNSTACVSVTSGLIDGCTFSNNQMEKSAVSLGSRTLLSNSLFENNVSATAGAAVIAANRSRIVDCEFVRNSAPTGGAILIYEQVNDYTVIERSQFIGNTASQHGGAIYGAGLIQNSIFIGNSAAYGGAVYDAIDTAGIELLNVTLTENSAQHGAVAYSEGAGVSLVNSIEWNNHTSQGQDLENFDAFNGGFGADHSILQSTSEWVTEYDSLYSNPLFVQSPSIGADNTWGTDDDIRGDLSLQSNSPGIDSGRDYAGFLALNRKVYGDVSNQLRTNGEHIDRGAYEFQEPLPIEVDDRSLTYNNTSSGGKLRFVPLVHAESDGAFTQVIINDQSITYTESALRSLQINTGAGHDLIEIESPLPATIQSGNGNDTIRAGSGADYIDSGAGNDRIYANAGDDTIRAGDGNDTISGGAQRDFIYGGAGNDRIGGNGGNDKLYGEANDDRIYGDDGNDYLSGGLRVDRLYGGLGNDTLDGGKSNDKLYGQDGNDRLEGDEGNDLISGSSGTDTSLDDEDDLLVTSIEILI